MINKKIKSEVINYYLCGGGGPAGKDIVKALR